MRLLVLLSLQSRLQLENSIQPAGVSTRFFAVGVKIRRLNVWKRAPAVESLLRRVTKRKRRSRREERGGKWTAGSYEVLNKRQEKAADEKLTSIDFDKMKFLLLLFVARISRQRRQRNVAVLNRLQPNERVLCETRRSCRRGKRKKKQQELIFTQTAV